MKRRYKTITINEVDFTLDTKETVKNPVIFYKSVYDVYNKCSPTKKSIWESWASWFRETNSHMFGVTSHNSHFFTISGCVTWVDEETKELTEYYLVITSSNNKAWRVERD